MLKDKIILLTGATDGIGKRAAFMLAQTGATMLLHGRNLNKGNSLTNEITQQTGNQNIHYINADFTSLSDINKLSEQIHEQFHHIDILINNAGVYENKKTTLTNGFEKTFMVNYLAGFSLTLKLMDLLEKSSAARIINVSSMIHAHNIDFNNLNAEKSYSADGAYSLSKLCNILFTYELSMQLKNKNITVNAMHPGVINTKLLMAGWGAIGDSPKEGAKRILFLATSDKVINITGKYFINDKPVKSTDITYNQEIRKRLWDLSLEYNNINYKNV